MIRSWLSGIGKETMPKTSSPIRSLMDHIKKFGGNAMKVIRGKLLLLIELDKGEDAHIVQVNCR